MQASDASVDPNDIGRFSERADAWWDPNGAFAALHRLNPARLGFIRSRLLAHFHRDGKLLAPFAGLRLLDIGCGGGLVAEPMARLGFVVTGADAGGEAIAAAAEHARAGGLEIDYRVASAESLASAGLRFDAVLALEVIEHLADRNAFWQALGELVVPGGAVIVATINRTLRSFALAIVGGEYVLGWIPRGTHDWGKFVRPSELVLEMRRSCLYGIEIAGLVYRPDTREWALSRDIAVNYLVAAIRR